MKIRNPKHEIRNELEARNSKRGVSNFEFWICFGFRISCFVLCLQVVGIATVWSDGVPPSSDGETPSLHAGTWKRLPDLPDPIGVAGAFAGVSGGALIVAGGANFPDAPPWEGGKKVFYDTVWALGHLDDQWKAIGKLPAPRAYGVSIQSQCLCIGGSDATSNYSNIWEFRTQEKIMNDLDEVTIGSDTNGNEIRSRRLPTRYPPIEFANLPKLPAPVANACGGRIHGYTMIFGGEAAPGVTTAMTNVWQANIRYHNQDWIAVPSWPGVGRTLAIGAAVRDVFFIAGGVELFAGPDGKPQRKYLRDAFGFDVFSISWRRIADLPFPLAAAPAATVNGKLVIFGGDDAPSADPKTHKGFRDEMLEYDPATDKWTIIGHMPAPRATAPVVFWNGGYVIVSGEVRRGVRSREVWMWTP